MLNTPILLITFNRPDHTRQTLQRILEARPRDLYIFQDGARKGNANDALKCQQVRDVINELVAEYKAKHSSSLLTLHSDFSEANLGCGAGPMTGISWFFDNVEQGIVMEDDCFAHPDFFPYCEELLNKFKKQETRSEIQETTNKKREARNEKQETGTEKQERVAFINSTLYDERWSRALNEERLTMNDSYGFSRYMVTGAWASYREVWQGFDLDLKDMSALKFAWHVYRLTGNLAEAEWWWYQVRAIQQDKNKKSYWDYQMQIHLFRQNALTIHPAVNLISNIGFDAEGTHTMTNDGRGDREVYPILPLSHPETVEVNPQRDMHCWAKKQSKGLLKDMLYIVYHLYAWRKKIIQ